MPAAAHPDTPLPFVTVTNWIRAARRCGIDIEALFLAEGVDLAGLHPTTALIRPAVVGRIMHRCLFEAQRLGCPHHFPIVLGDTFAFEYLADVETFISTSATLRDAARALDWIPPLVNPLMTFELQEFGDQARITLHLGGGTPVDEAWPFIEAAFTTLVKFSRTLLGDLPLAGRLTQRHAAHAQSRLLAEHLRVELEPDADIDALWFDRALLDRPLIGALPALHELAARRITEEIARRGPPPLSLANGDHEAHPLVCQIEQAMLSQPELLGQGLPALATALGLHARTLQRRLREAGDSHSAILDRVRFHLARQWLAAPGARIESVSARLGFTDRRSFTQAFIRWAGVPPSRFRDTPPPPPDH